MTIEMEKQYSRSWWRLFAIVFFVLAVVAWLGRWEVKPGSHPFSPAVRLDRWTGRVEVLQNDAASPWHPVWQSVTVRQDAPEVEEPDETVTHMKDWDPLKTYDPKTQRP